ncbi:ABC transporter ATP-binding protein [Eubacterium sp. 1001713B170207_170306_E7]|uniref:metal ABC transporter ATP-binding protein n=1 Tax=Eubacterium sp. 1001713B170207_170306_E7 TaxID=2787097 RepID=UPI001899331B|nr:ABC transporter ATP-binding protein [Eubacterium sp. 1001713B170207_170306_E7]
MALFTCKDVSFAYDGVTAVEGLNFEINAGDYLGIVGENGAGKSTLIAGLLGLKSPGSGQIMRGDGLEKNEIGYLPQKSNVQRDFPASVYEVVLSGRLNRQGFRPFYHKADKKAVQVNLRRLGIAPLKKRCFRELSGGQQQRVLLARALCATEKLLLLDEPAAGLDPMATRRLYELVYQINKKLGISVVMVSHDIESVMRYNSHVLHLGGRQLFYGTVDAYRGSAIGWKFLGGEAHV